MTTGHEVHHYRTPSRLALYVAPRLGLRAGTVEQLIRGRNAVHMRTAMLYEAAIAVGDHALAAMIVAPLDAIRAGGQSTETPRELLEDDTKADAGEDSARVAYLLNPNADTRNELLRCCRNRAGWQARFLAALEREQREARA